MNTPNRFATLAVALTTLFTAHETASAQVKVSPGPLIIREQLNQTYGPEVLEYTFAGKGDPQAIRVTGPKGAVPAQLMPLPDNTGKLYLLVDELKPLSSVNYTIAFDKNAAPATDLKVNKTKDAVEITTANVGVKLRLGGEKPAKPIAFKDVPGFLIASRMGTGAWAGSSAFTGDAPVNEWSSQIETTGPVLTRVVFHCTFADGNTLMISATVVAGDNTVRWQMHTPQDKPELGITLNLTPIPGLKTAVLPKGYGQWAKEDKTAPVTPGPAPFANLSANSSVVSFFPDSPWLIRLGEGATQMELTARDMGSWVEPAPIGTLGGFTHWDLNMIPKSWDNWKRKRIPVIYGNDGTITLTPNLAKGGRKWNVSAGAPKVGDRLNDIKEMVLDWPADAKRPHPRVFVDNADIQAARERAKTDAALQKSISSSPYVIALSVLNVLAKPAAERTKPEADKVVEELRKKLAMMGNYDVMRWAIADVCLYDAMIDSDLITPQDKALFRAQMAYLGYVLADPQTWSIERGFHSGNPNMSLSYTLSSGVLACALVDHPMAKKWSDYASSMLDATLSNEVGANGEWLPEGSHYGYVSLEPMVAYAVAAKRAGFRDFTNDERLKKCALYFAKTNTPPDLERGNFRRSGAFGRGTSGDHFYVFGTAAKMTLKSDPEFSKTMEWLSDAASGFPPATNDFRLGGYEDFYNDHTLPQAAPAWNSELFPQFAAILRAGFNTPNESYLNFLAATDSERNLDIWVAGIGGITQWFGRGKPLSTCFNFKTGYAERHEFLRDGVRLARNWGQPNDPKGPFGYYTKTSFGTFASFPQGDYVRSNFVNTKVDDRDWFPDNLPAFPLVTPAKEGKLDWTRQLMFMKDADPAGSAPAYIVLRDTTKGGQPTAWQFWTLSEKLGTPEQAADAAFLADKPGQTNKPARELPAGARYTALGQFGVDVEYFIASPSDTPRHTLRMGGPDNARIPEWEDLLHLQLPGDGTYFVAIFPRPHAEAAPTFTKLADGKVIKATGAFGTDYAFLSSDESTSSAEGVSFKGTAGSLQQRAAATTLTLGAAGEVKWTDYAIASPIAVSIKAAKESFTLSIPADSAGGEVKITAPAGMKHKDAAGVKVAFKDGVYTVTVPASKSAATIEFSKK